MSTFRASYALLPTVGQKRHDIEVARNLTVGPAGDKSVPKYVPALFSSWPWGFDPGYLSSGYESGTVLFKGVVDVHEEDEPKVTCLHSAASKVVAEIVDGGPELHLAEMSDESSSLDLAGAAIRCQFGHIRPTSTRSKRRPAVTASR